MRDVLAEKAPKMRCYKSESRDLLSTTDGQPDAADRQRARSVLSGLLAYRHPSGQDPPNSCSSAFHLQKKRDWEDVVGPLQQTKTEDRNIKAIKDRKQIYRWWDIRFDEKCVYFFFDGLLQMCKLVLLLLISVISEIQHD